MTPDMVAMLAVGSMVIGAIVITAILAIRNEGLTRLKNEIATRQSREETATVVLVARGREIEGLEDDICHANEALDGARSERDYAQDALHRATECLEKVRHKRDTAQHEARSLLVERDANFVALVEARRERDAARTNYEAAQLVIVNRGDKIVAAARRAQELEAKVLKVEEEVRIAKRTTVRVANDLTEERAGLATLANEFAEERDAHAAETRRIEALQDANRRAERALADNIAGQGVDAQMLKTMHARVASLEEDLDAKCLCIEVLSIRINDAARALRPSTKRNPS